ncbi:hypothetical protein F4678DRAFT_176133 [Xylaria arbuscula]|nr:hypothetical protein F4678DRAFT_176133 [Xylaria arbuscula]
MYLGTWAPSLSPFSPLLSTVLLPQVLPNLRITATSCYSWVENPKSDRSCPGERSNWSCSLVAGHRESSVNLFNRSCCPHSNNPPPYLLSHLLIIQSLHALPVYQSPILDSPLLALLACSDINGILYISHPSLINYAACSFLGAFPRFAFTYLC